MFSSKSLVWFYSEDSRELQRAMSRGRRLPEFHVGNTPSGCERKKAGGEDRRVGEKYLATAHIWVTSNGGLGYGSEDGRKGKD